MTKLSVIQRCVEPPHPTPPHPTPPAPIGSGWVPRSTNLPSLSTRIRSAASTVDSRCAITNEVRSFITRFRASWIIASE